MSLCPALTASAAYLPPANRPFTLRDKDWEMPAQDRVSILGTMAPHQPFFPGPRSPTLASTPQPPCNSAQPSCTQPHGMAPLPQTWRQLLGGTEPMIVSWPEITMCFYPFIAVAWLQVKRPNTKPREGGRVRLGAHKIPNDHLGLTHLNGLPAHLPFIHSALTPPPGPR